MKHIILIFLLLPMCSFSQNIEGDWYGDIDISGMKLGFVLHIKSENETLKSIFDIPKQNAKDIAMTSTTFADNQLTVSSKELGGEFKAEYREGKFIGSFSQNGGVFPFSMSQEVREEKKTLRPQEPKPKFNYKIEEVMFENKMDKVTLAGTLTLPKGKGPFPAVVLVSGSGPQDRNEEILGHKPFWVIADYLTNKGIAVLRYDDRGVGKSTGDFSQGTTEDFARDASAGVEFLMSVKTIDPSKVGIVGHSEGGTIAPIVAANPKNNIGFIVLLAGTAIPGTEILLKQQELIAAINGASEEEIRFNSVMSTAIFQFLRDNSESETVKKDMAEYLSSYMDEHATELPEGISKKDRVDVLVNTYVTPWMLNFLLYDPKFAFLNVKCPVLALNGSNDLQVTPKENLSTFQALAKKSGNTHVQTIECPGLNHLFQHSETGSPNEYAEIEETFSPEVLELITDWILNLKN